MQKKFLALTLVIIMLFGIFSPVKSIAAEVMQINDSAGTSVNMLNSDMVELLRALNIFVGDKDTGALRPNDNITRAEFAKVAVNLLGLGSLVSENVNVKSSFPDVPLGHWATQFIQVAADQKVVIGDETGLYRPEDNISFQEAATVMVRILGHEPAALSNGGYPEGFLSRAAQIGILKDTVIKSGEPATRADAITMSYNSLFINIMKQTSFGNTVSYEVVDETILENNMDTKKEYGQIVETFESGLSAASNLRTDEVQIKVGDTTSLYKVGTSDANNRLGQNVVFYFKETKASSSKELLLTLPDADKMTLVEISSENIDSIDATNRKISYWVNKDTDKNPKTITLSDPFKTFYNGVATTDTAYSLTNLAALMTSGSLKLIDNGKDDIYDLLFINKYTNYVVDEVVPSTYKITDKGGNTPLILDPNDTSIKFNITYQGNPIELSALQEFDVLSVRKSADGKIINAEVNRKKVTGKVSEVKSATEVIIEGKEYKIGDNTTGLFTLELGSTGDFYLDSQDRIAWFEGETTTSNNYAFLVDAKAGTGIDTNLEFKFYSLTGTTSKLSGADKIKLNSEGSFDSATLLTKLQASANTDFATISQVAQLVTYSTNSNNEVISIQTAKNNTANMNNLPNEFSMDVKNASLTYKQSAKKLGNFNLNNSTIVFAIPKTTTGTATTDYSIRDISMFVDNNSYDVEIYDLTSELQAKVVLVKNSVSNVDENSSVAVVEKITTTTNQNDEEVGKLYAFQDGKLIQVAAKDNIVLASSKTGDIIQYATNAQGEIDKITTLLAAADKDTEASFQFKTYANSKMETIYGIVDQKFANSINIKVSDGTIYNYPITNANVYEFNDTKINNQVTNVTTGDIVKYDDIDPYAVFVRLYESEVKDIVIIKLNSAVSF